MRLPVNASTYLCDVLAHDLRVMEDFIGVLDHWSRHKCHRFSEVAVAGDKAIRFSACVAFWTSETSYSLGHI